MRWVISLTASSADAERLSESLPDLSAHPVERGELTFEVQMKGDEPTSEMTHAVKAHVDARVRSINGFGKLRWGRTFEGVELKSIRSVAPNGREALHLTTGIAYGHLLPREFADMLERLGFPRPPLPAGLETIESLDAGAVIALSERNLSVSRVLHLVESMLEGDAQINWGAAYTALEVVENDLHARGVDGRSLGWWTKRERNDFKATANSVEVLGVLARHGVPTGVSESRMEYVSAAWYVRRVVAYWLTHLMDGDG